MAETKPAVSPATDKPAEVRVHWLAFTMFNLSRMECRVQCERAMDFDRSEWELNGHGRLGYHFAMQGPDGVVIAWSTGRPDTHVVLPGKACDRVGQERMTEILSWILKRGGRVTRLDLAMDDFAMRVRPQFVADALDGPTAVTRVKRYSLRHTKARGGSATGELLHVGAIKSGRYLKVYDKRLESDGETESIRWELTAKEHAAMALALALSRRVDWGLVFAEFLVGFLDFRQVGRARITDRPRCDWYAAVVGDAKAAKVGRPEKRDSLSRALSWIQYSVSPWLAVVLAACGGDSERFLVDIGVDDGKKRWRGAHRRVLAQVATESGDGRRHHEQVDPA